MLAETFLRRATIHTSKAVYSLWNSPETESEVKEESKAVRGAVEEYEEPEKGFVNVTREKVLRTIERVSGQDFSCRVRKIETGKYEAESLASGEAYTVELNRGIFGVTAHCDCPDFTFTRLGRNECCKHIAAVYQFERQDRVISLKMAA
jgi:hypothetical protein